VNTLVGARVGRFLVRADTREILGPLVLVGVGQRLEGGLRGGGYVNLLQYQARKESKYLVTKQEVLL
jgi:hypothetical protein